MVEKANESILFGKRIEQVFPWRAELDLTFVVQEDRSYSPLLQLFDDYES